jgi:ribosomal protein S28E/S33
MLTQNDLNSLLDEHLTFAASAAKRQGEHPQDRKPREQLVAEASRGGITSTRGIGRFISVPEQYYPCTVPFGQLEKEKIRNLQLETHHRGRYLLVRAITGPVQYDGVVMVVEDEDGDAVQLELYHQLGPRVLLERKDKEMPTMGTFVVKEPYFQVTLRGDYVVRVDHLSDIVWLPDTDERVPAGWRSHLRNLTANDWRVEGNAAFRAGCYREAIAKLSPQCYCTASVII